MIPKNQCRCCLFRFRDLEGFKISSCEPEINYSQVIIADLLTDCIGIKFSIAEVENCFICLKCRKNLIEFYNWKSLILDANERLITAREEKRKKHLAKLELENPMNEEYLEEIDVKEEEVEDDGEEMDIEYLEEEFVVEKTEEIFQIEERKIIEAKPQEQSYERHEGGLFHCGKCLTTFSFRGRLERHLQTEHAFEDQDKFECNFCGEIFEAYKYLKKHITSEHEEKPFTCDLCGNKYAEFSYVRNHIKRMHLGQKRKVKVMKKACEICKKVLKDRRQYEFHFKSFHMPQEGNSSKFECKICGARLADKKGLQRHTERLHSGKDPSHPCSECGKILRSKYTLESHMKLVHEGIRNFHCETCGKTLKSAPALRHHMSAAHSTERPFRCDYCEGTFKTANCLRLHMRRMHTSTGEVQCPQCESWFKNELCLKDHLETHKNEDHPCSYCGSIYTTKKLMMQHIASVHVRLRCILCGYKRPKKCFMIDHFQVMHPELIAAGDRLEDYYQKEERKICNKK